MVLKRRERQNTTKIKLVGRVLPTIATKVRSSASNFKVCYHFRLDLKTNKQASSHPHKNFLFSSFFSCTECHQFKFEQFPGDSTMRGS